MVAEPKVFVAQPVYLGVHPHAVLGATAHASAVPERTVYKCNECPFHCANFNALWCTALNSRKDFGWTHFAMLHQDIQPCRNWVDILVDEMAREQVDLLSVVMPIKDELGATSTAILNTQKRTTRRLTMREIVQYLPPTFRSHDLKKMGHKNHLLLHGSGMWICDFSQAWVEKVWFEAPARIQQIPSGEFISCVWDEGWNFSLQLYNLGRTLACTRRTPANHLGGGVWGNEEAWGEWETDSGDINQEWVLGNGNATISEHNGRLQPA